MLGEPSAMRSLLALLIAFLVLGPLAARELAVVTYPDGTRESFQSPNEALRAFLDFLVGSQDGKVVLQARGKEMVAVKTGEQVEFGYEGHTETTTGRAIVERFEQARRKHDPLQVCEANLKDLAAALRRYAASHDGHYPVSLTELVPGYLESLPECPTVSKDTYSRGYEMMVNPDQFYVRCYGDHSASGLSEGFPLIDSQQGLVEGL